MPRKSEKKKKDVRDYRFKDAKRVNNPPAGIAHGYEIESGKQSSYNYDPHLDSQLQWTGNSEITLRRRKGEPCGTARTLVENRAPWGGTW